MLQMRHAGLCDRDAPESETDIRLCMQTAKRCPADGKETCIWPMLWTLSCHHETRLQLDERDGSVDRLKDHGERRGRDAGDLA